MKILFFLIVLLVSIWIIGFLMLADVFAHGYKKCEIDPNHENPYHLCEPKPEPTPTPTPLPIPPPSPEPAPEPSKNEPQSVSGGVGRVGGINPNICEWPQHFDKEYCETGVPTPDLDEIQRKLDEIKRQIIEIEIGIMLLRC